jgi:hypothetical protein
LKGLPLKASKIHHVKREREREREREGKGGTALETRHPVKRKKLGQSKFWAEAWAEAWADHLEVQPLDSPNKFKFVGAA